MSSVVGDIIESTGAWPEGLAYRFPRRSLARGRFAVWLAVLVLVALSYWMVAGPILRLVVNGVTVSNVISVAFWSLLAVQLARYPLWSSLALLFGHREVGLQVDSLRTADCIGGLRRSKNWPLARIKRLQVVDLLPAAPQTDSGIGFVNQLHVLTGVLDNGKRFVIAPGFPRSLLDPFAEELSKRISLALGQDCIDARDWPEASGSLPPSFGETIRVETARSIGIPQLIAEVQEAARKSAEPDEFIQPLGSDVQIDRFPEGITFRVPPAGIWTGSAGMFQFGILWCIVIGGFTILFACAGIAGGAGVSAIFNLLAVMSIFGLAGAGLLLGGWTKGKRETAVAVVGERVMVMQTGLRRAKRREWSRSEVKTVRVGPSDLEVNDKPIVELQIHGATGKLFGMLAGRDERELTWMATLLRQSLKNPGPLGPEKVPSDHHQMRSGDNVAVASTNRDVDIDYRGMTINERLLVARISEAFADAVQSGDRLAMVEMLRVVQLPESGAEAYADAVIADPHDYGY